MKSAYASVIAILLLCLNIATAQDVDYPRVSSPVTYGQVANLPGVSPTQQIVYGDNKDIQFGQLWVPKTTTKAVKGLSPLVVLIHGGCWLSEYDIVHTQALSTALSQAGYFVWSLEYRRVGDDGGGWPGTFLDISRGVDWVRKLFEEYPIDPQQVAFIGHSAGGHLALWAAGRQQLASENTVNQSLNNSLFNNKDVIIPKAVIALAPITNLEDYANDEGSCNQAVVLLMGGTVEDFRQRYQLANPSSVFQPPTVVAIVCGEADPIVPVSQVQSFFDKANGDVFLHHIPNAGHFDLIHPGTQSWQTIMDLLSAALHYFGGEETSKAFSKEAGE